jgi:hypothetical protein
MKKENINPGQRKFFYDFLFIVVSIISAIMIAFTIVFGVIYFSKIFYRNRSMIQ